MIVAGLARIGRDAEVRFTGSGDAVASLALAFAYGRKDGNGRRPTTWIEASLWGERAQKLAEYLTKGTSISVVLEELHGETFTKDGSSTVKLRARVVSLEFAGGGRQAEQSHGDGNSQRPASAPPRQKDKAPHAGFDDMSDDVPF